MKLILIFVLLLIFTFPPNCFSQPAQLQLADNYFESEQYYNAITEYKRFLFFNPQYGSAPEIEYRIGLSYKFNQKWTEAVDVFRTISNVSDDSLSYKSRLQIGIVYLASGKLDMAEYELLRIATFCKLDLIRNKSDFYLGLCYIYKSDWQNAKEYLDKYYVNNCQLKTDKLDSILNLSCKFHYRSPSLAKWLSTFVPGSGQLYAGDIKNSVNAILINSLTIYLAINSIIGRQIWDLLIIDITIFERFYNGNRVKAEDYVIDKNAKISESLRKQIISEINKINNSSDAKKCIGYVEN